MYVTSREVKNTKYVANFHTKSAADEFQAFLNNLMGVDRELVGVTRVRNSVVYTMECFKKGYTLAKQFEDDYIARMTPPSVEPTPAPIPEPEPIPEPIVEPAPEIMELIQEEVVDSVDEIIEEELTEEITEEELAQAVEDFTEEPSVFEEEKPTGAGPLTSKITGFFKGNNKINTN